MASTGENQRAPGYRIGVRRLVRIRIHPKQHTRQLAEIFSAHIGDSAGRVVARVVDGQCQIVTGQIKQALRVGFDVASATTGLNHPLS